MSKSLHVVQPVCHDKCCFWSSYLAHGVWEDDEGCEPISIHTENHGDCGQHQQTEAGDWPGRHLPCPYFCLTQTSGFSISRWNSINWGTSGVLLGMRETYKTVFQYFVEHFFCNWFVNFCQHWYFRIYCLITLIFFAFKWVVYQPPPLPPDLSGL